MIENLDITTKMSFCLGFSYFDHSFGNLILIFFLILTLLLMCKMKLLESTTTTTLSSFLKVTWS